MTALDLRAQQSHFAFGDNWRSFVDEVDDTAVADAVLGLAKLLPPEELAGRRFLDIGCGSGLSMLAAARLGAARVVGFDIDPVSVAAAEALLGPRLSGGWRAAVKSVFDLDTFSDGIFDIVHSWGVLHHTGDMWQAMRNAAAMTAPGGTFVFALYRKTPMCGFWRREKQFYASATPPVQAMLRGTYRAALAARLAVRGESPTVALGSARTTRGMDKSHDLHDWMGGYPYESASPDEVFSFLEAAGFNQVRSFLVPTTRGVFGSGCDEYVATRRP